MSQLSRRPLRAATQCALLALWVLVVAAAAQDEGGVVRSSADYVYGQTMRFHLNATGIGKVEDITLFLRLGTSSDTFSVDMGMPESPGIDVGYTLDLTQTRLPPFTTITYWWEIERPGDTLQVPEQVITYVDDQFNWSQLIETDGRGGGSIRFHWTGEGERLGELARDLVLEMLPPIGRSLPLQEVLPFDVYLYPSSSDLSAALRLAGREYSPGQTFPDLGVVLVTVVNPATAEPELRQGLSRGLVDLLLYQALGQFSYDVPPWLSRGIAGVARGVPDVTLDNALRAALSSETTLPVPELCAGQPVDTDLAAAQSEALVAYIAQSYGDEAIRALVMAFAEGDDCPAALRRVIQLTPDQLEAAWLRSLRTGEGGRSAAELVVWGTLLVAGFGLAGLLLWRGRSERAQGHS